MKQEKFKVADYPTEKVLCKHLGPSIRLLNRRGSDKSQWSPNEQCRSDAEDVVNIVFGSIVEALRNGEMVSLPIGTFEVQERKRRKKIEFTPDEEIFIKLNEPATSPWQTGLPCPVPRKKRSGSSRDTPGSNN
jgi:nucleoid DNA-binding protein